MQRPLDLRGFAVQYLGLNRIYGTLSAPAPKDVQNSYGWETWMHRRHLLIGGASLFALSGCASAGAVENAVSGAVAALTTADEARIARAVLPTTAPRAELLQPWTGPYEGVPPW
ncbi:MAG TPA: M3 family peptidase, partial [Brevundimonas sp.]|nr:M3 family peptidase [Brevundimonas sp.]